MTGGIVMARLQDVHDLLPGHCECVRFHSEGELRLLIDGIKVAIICP